MVKKKHINDEPCDKEVVNVDVNDLDENEFEKLYVHEIYESISVHFSHTRYAPWKNVLNSINSVEKNSIILDVGCGNGKYLNLRDDAYFLGIDVCKSFLHICNDKGKDNLLLSNNLRLPLKENVADLTISIAVLHHISTPNRRLDAIRELIRCTKPNGKILIYVWSFEQDKSYIGYREFNSQDVLVPWNLQSIYSRNNTDKYNKDNNGSNNKDNNKENKENKHDTNENNNNDYRDDSNNRYNTNNNKDTDKDTKEDNSSKSQEEKSTSLSKKDLNFKRYYHVFKREEIVEICNHFHGLAESTIYTDCNNWVIEMCKL